MSLITHIDGVPLYTSISEAELWGSQYNITGYHEHKVLGVTGYMAGTNHDQISRAILGGVINPLSVSQLRTTTNQSLPQVNNQQLPTQQQTQPQLQSMIRRNFSSGSSSSGGSGGY